MRKHIQKHLFLGLMLILLMIFSCKSRKVVESNQKLKAESLKVAVKPLKDTLKDAKAINNEENKNIHYKYDANNNITEIIFKDEKTGQILSTFNPIENNPFSHLKYKRIQYDETNYIIYDLNGVNLNEIVPPEKRKNYIKDYGNIQLKRASVNQTVYNSNKNYVAIGYWMVIEVDDYMCVGVLGSFVVLDKKGSVIIKEEQLEYPVNLLALTDDGRFLSILYCGADVEHPPVFKSGYKIYDIKNRKVLIDKDIDFKYKDIATQSLNGVIIIYLLAEGKEEVRVLYAFKENKIYNKIFNFDELYSIEKITSDCIFFKNRSGEDQKNCFVKDFKMEGEF